MQEMQVFAIGLDFRAAAPVLLLREAANGHRVLPVWVGAAEANAIELERQHIRTPRPTAYQLIAEVIAFCGRHLEQVCVTMLEQDILHAELLISPDIRVSARVSDAVALALHLGVPIHAADTVLDQASLDDVQAIDTGSPRERGDAPSAGSLEDSAELERMRRFLDQATPEDFDTT
jgi:bifunctional DNase/RNase